MLQENRYVTFLLNIVILILEQGASAAPVHDDNIFVWNATIFGPSETCWEGLNTRPLQLRLSCISYYVQEEFIRCALRSAIVTQRSRQKLGSPPRCFIQMFMSMETFVLT